MCALGVSERTHSATRTYAEYGPTIRQVQTHVPLHGKSNWGPNTGPTCSLLPSTKLGLLYKMESSPFVRLAVSHLCKFYKRTQEDWTALAPTARAKHTALLQSVWSLAQGLSFLCLSLALFCFPYSLSVFASWFSTLQRRRYRVLPVILVLTLGNTEPVALANQ